MEEEIRINKYLSAAGFCSRREADRLLQEGRVEIDGLPVRIGMKVRPGQSVTVDGVPVRSEDPPVVLLFHKPPGIVCTAEKREKNNVIDYVNYPVRIYPVGRLDKASRGLLLLTNRGDLANLVMKAGDNHEKEYVVRLNRPYGEEFLQQMAGGIYLEELDRTTAPCEISRVSADTFRIILHQGLNRQIRRMSEALGYRVTDLKRVRIMNLLLGDLKEGAYREITEEELSELMELLGKSPEKENGTPKEPNRIVSPEKENGTPKELNRIVNPEKEKGIPKEPNRIVSAGHKKRKGRQRP